MRGNWMIAACASGLGLGLLAIEGRAAVTGATVADATTANYNLTSVTVDRGSAGSITYLPSQLTGVDLTDVAAYSVPLMTQNNASIPAPGTRATLLEDNRLDTGVTSPVTYFNPIDLAFEVTFLRPVVNSTGDDIVLFTLGSNTTTQFYINNDKSQYANVVMDANSPKVVSGVTVGRIGYKNPNTNSATVYDLAELESPTGYFFATTLTYDVYAASIDLSSFGVPLGGSVSSLRFQAASNRISPVYIAGLPAVPEPTALIWMVGASVGLLRPSRRRTCE